MSVNEKMTAIADSIRAATGDTDLLTLDDIEKEVPRVFEAGKQAEHNQFWENYHKGQDIWADYTAYTGNGWNINTFYPTKDIVLSHKRTSHFAYFNYGFTEFDLRQRLMDCGVTLDTSNVTNAMQMFNVCKVTVLPILDFRNATNLNYAFSECSVVTIEKLILSDAGNQNLKLAGFWKNLENIVIEGVIGSDVSFSASPLTIESALSVINALKDYSETETTHTLTLSDTTKAYLSDSDIAIATQKGWTVA